MAKKFKHYADNMSITVNIMSMKTHHSIEMIERYHGPLRKIYNIITSKISDIEENLTLQMIFKALNDSIESNDLMSTLLIFGAYPRMIDSDASSSTINQRSTAIKRAMKEVRKIMASRTVSDALNIRNDSSSSTIHDLPINSRVLIYRERIDAGSEA